MRHQLICRTIQCTLRNAEKREMAAERLLRRHPRFCKSLMVYVGLAVSELGCIPCQYCQEVKLDGTYYCEVLLKKQRLPNHAAHCW